MECSGIGDTGTGVVIVTSFRCQSLLHMLAIMRLHGPMKRRVGEAVVGFIDVHLFIDWRNRTLKSVSLWTTREAACGMGQVPAHIKAARLPGRWGVSTTCGVFEYSGDWKRVLLGGEWEGPSPLS